jgi:hypothetical protein
MTNTILITCSLVFDIIPKENLWMFLSAHNIWHFKSGGKQLSTHQEISVIWPSFNGIEFNTVSAAFSQKQTLRQGFT